MRICFQEVNVRSLSCIVSMSWLTPAQAVVHPQNSPIQGTQSVYFFSSVDADILLACTMIFDPSMYVHSNFGCLLWPLRRSGLATSSAWMPLLYDTIVFLLTLQCVLQPRSGRFSTFALKKRLFEDGLIYYRYSMRSGCPRSYSAASCFLVPYSRLTSSWLSWLPLPLLGSRT